MKSCGAVLQISSEVVSAKHRTWALSHQEVADENVPVVSEVCNCCRYHLSKSEVISSLRLPTMEVVAEGGRLTSGREIPLLCWKIG